MSASDIHGSAEISVTRVHGPTLLALQGGGWVSNLQKKTLRKHVNGAIYNIINYKAHRYNVCDICTFHIHATQSFMRIIYGIVYRELQVT